MAKQAGQPGMHPGAKTSKSAATRERIMEAATDLMVERGGTGFQIGEVSERCGMSKGALYYYFADKGALVQAIFDRSMEGLVSDVETVVAQAPSARASILGLVEAVALDANLTKVEARKAIDAMIRVTVQALREGERLTLTGLGSFSIQQKAERVGRNPRTGAAVKIPARKVIRFRPAVEIE